MTAHPQPAGASHILLTGRPGVGKTTVVMRLAERLKDRRVAGFYTDEIREQGRRQGFRVTTFSGRTAILAHVGVKTPHRVGRYGVDVAAFEELALPELGRPSDLMLIDEIGRMECFSACFISAVRELLDGAVPVVATIAISGGGFIAEVKRRPDVDLWTVSPATRDELPQRLAARLESV
jgi:nucleoside-triphosphatase